MTEWVRLVLDLAEFDDRKFEQYLLRCRRSGVTLCTLADVGDTMENRLALYELNRTCSADIPGQGVFCTVEEYLRARFTPPSYDPRGVVLALRPEAWVGLAATSLHLDDGFAFSEMTGVLREHRGQGVALAMKLLAIRFARSAGARRLRTVHHPENAVAIAMNRRMGYTDL